MGIDSIMSGTVQGSSTLVLLIFWTGYFFAMRDCPVNPRVFSSIHDLDTQNAIVALKL